MPTGMSNSIRRRLVGLRLAQVPGGARAADHRAGEAPGHGVFLLTDADVDVALLEDAVVGDQAHRVLEQSSRNGSSQSPMSASSFSRHVLVDAADAEIIGVHARARRALVELHQLLAHLEQPQVRRHRADVHDVAAEVEQVGQMRASSAISTRINWPRSGTSRPISFSTAST